MNARVVFVGAGPVGLMTAIQTKLYDPSLPILMLEKYDKYKRQHSLILEKSSFNDAHPDADWQKFIRALPHHIRTNELEAQLIQYADKLGIQIKKNCPVTNCHALLTEYPDADCFIGADGSHSIVHKQIFNHQYQIKKTLRYIVEVKYDAEGKTRYLDPLSELAPAITYANHLVSEYVGKEKDNKTPIALRIFVDQATYDKMQDATFKEPYKLSKLAGDDKPKEITKLYQTIRAWITAREMLGGEKQITDSERITATNLPVYASNEFVKETNGKTWCLVGDAAFGVPYFRSLNNGILCSSQLARVIDAKIHHKEIETYSFSSISSSSKLAAISAKQEAPFTYYVNYVQALVNSENILAHIKDLGVSSLQSTAYTSQAVPLSRVKIAVMPRGEEFKQAMHEIREEPMSSSSSLSSFSSFNKTSKEDKMDVEETSTKSVKCVMM